MNKAICPECLTTHVTTPDKEGLIDCLECGIWFNPLHPNNQPDSPNFGKQIEPGSNELYCEVCDRDASETCVIARWLEQWERHRRANVMHGHTSGRFAYTRCFWTSNASVPGVPAYPHGGGGGLTRGAEST
jgi:hypothetical protein